jgi:hypothetical protein
MTKASMPSLSVSFSFFSHRPRIESVSSYHKSGFYKRVVVSDIFEYKLTFLFFYIGKDLIFLVPKAVEAFSGIPPDSLLSELLEGHKVCYKIFAIRDIVEAEDLELST